MLFSNKTKKSNTSSDMDRAKRLYFSNYANYRNMMRNGEYEEYMKYSIPNAVEHEWSKIILDSLVKKVQNGENIWLVYNIANVRIDESEIIKSFQTLSKSPNVREIITALKNSSLLSHPTCLRGLKRRCCLKERIFTGAKICKNGRLERKYLPSHRRIIL